MKRKSRVASTLLEKCAGNVIVRNGAKVDKRSADTFICDKQMTKVSEKEIIKNARRK